MKEIKSVNILSGGGGSPEPVASATLGLRLALNATARACSRKRGFACRALDSAQGKPCSVALLGLAFTMAEILLSLTIIGVVAAITLPSLTGNINERTWNTQRKALYARMSQAIMLMPALNGYGTLTEGDSSTSAEDTAAETFVTAGLSKVLKINNVCDNEHLEDCGITSKFTTLTASTVSSFPDTLVKLNSMFNSSVINGCGTSFSYSQLDTKAAAFETANGESIVVYYNPRCVSAMGETNFYTQPKLCANFIYDLNGTKGPNTLGKDMGFISAFYPTDTVVVAPMPLLKALGPSTQQEAGPLCTDNDSESRLPTREEVMSMWVNKNLIGSITTMGMWTSSVESSTQAWLMDFLPGRLYVSVRSRTDVYTRCVKR